MLTNLLFALTIGLFIGGVAGYIGSLMLTKRMALIGGPLGHLTLPGISIAYAYGFDVSLGALLFLVFGATVIWLLQNKTKLPFEAITATVFASSLSIAFLTLKRGKAKQALIGDISQISPYVVLWTVLTSIAIFFIMRFIYKRMVLISISSDLAQTNGINIKLHNFIFLTCIAITVALSVRIIGGLMTAALIAIPACTSRNISLNLVQYAYISMIAGSASCALGIFVASLTNLPPGPLIVLASTMLFVVSIFIKPQRFLQT